MKKKDKAHAVTWACRCGTKYSALSTDPDLHLVPDRFKCWGPLQCRYYFNRDDKLVPGPVVRAITIFEMISGMGSPDERKCGPADLQKMMVGKKVKSISVEASPDRRRSFITKLTLEDGKTVHFATSTRGATIYKVTNE